MRTFLSLLMVFVFALAGSVILAQTGSESPLQEVAPAQEGMAPEPSTDAGAGTQESLPATASPLPLAFAIGVMALGAASALRVYRLRSPH